MAARSLMDCLEGEVTGALGSRAEEGSSTTIYRLRVTLADIEPAVWRLVEVPDLTLGGLHDVLQVVMGWEDCHLHQFVVNGESYGQAASGDLDTADEEGIRLSGIFTGRKKPRLLYEYDFGDSWRHEVRLEKRLEPDSKVEYPRCVEGARACPPEDCGGPWGYADLLEAIGDPKHPEHRDMKEWVGGRFDPKKFSADKVNKGLRRAFRPGAP
jgi:hypothetical protein